MRVTLIHNPESGAGDHDRERIVEKLARYGDEVSTIDPHDSQFAERLCGSRGEICVVAGGDGTVAKVVRSILDRCDMPVLILPLGTANNIAMTLGIDKPELDLRKVQSEWIAKPTDLVAVDDTIALESAGCGVLAGFMRVASDDEREGVRRESRSLADRVEESPLFDFRLSADGEEMEGEAIAIEAMVTRQMGPRVVLAANADPGDGFFDLIVIGESSRQPFAEYLRSRLKRKPPSFESRLTRSVTIACDAPWHIDGEMTDRRTRTITIREAAWRALVPAR